MEGALPAHCITTDLAVVIIAAGSSSRLGQPKQLVAIRRMVNGSLKRQSLIKHTAILAKNICDNVLCVVGFNAEKMSAELNGLQVECTINRNWDRGMGSSISCGVSRLRGDPDGVLIMLCDQWALTDEDINRLITTWRQTPHKIIASHYFEKKQNMEVVGAPAIFPRIYFSHLKKLSETGARKLITERLDDVIKVNINNAALDLDTKEDLRLFESNFDIEKMRLNLNSG